MFLNYFLVLMAILKITKADPPVLDPSCGKVFQNDAFYSTKNLYKSSDYFSSLQSNHFPENSTIYFNFCKFTSKKCQNNSLLIQEQPTYALVITPDGECTKITADYVFSGIDRQLLNDNNPGEGIKIYIPDGDKYLTGSFSLKYYLKCDNKVSGFELQKVTQSNDIIEIYGVSEWGCPQLLATSLWEVLEVHQIEFTIGFMILGFGFCFYGNMIRRYTRFATGIITGFGFIIGVLGEYVLSPSTENSVVYALLVVGVLFGILLGYVTITQKRVGTFLLGMWIGIIFALLLNNTLLYLLASTYSLLISICIIGVIFGALGVFYHGRVTILSSSVMGSYLLIRPLGWYVGHWPNEFTLVKQIKYKTVRDLPKEFYLYLILFILLAGLGIVIQFTRYLRKKKIIANDSQLEDKLLNFNNDQEGETNDQMGDILMKSTSRFLEAFQKDNQESSDEDIDFKQSSSQIKKFNLTSTSNDKKEKKIVHNINQDSDEEDDPIIISKKKNKKSKKKDKPQPNFSVQEDDQLEQDEENFKTISSTNPQQIKNSKDHFGISKQRNAKK